MVKEFSKEAIDNLKYYVYKLIDPRDGKVFYIGKGKGNRVFSHINLSLRYESRDEEISDKISLIREIKNDGLDVITIIHRHGINDEDTAYQVEAALIDEYNNLTNIQGGHNSNDYGPINVNQVENIYRLEKLVIDDIDKSDKLLLIKIREEYIKNNDNDILKWEESYNELMQEYYDNPPLLALDNDELYKPEYGETIDNDKLSKYTDALNNYIITIIGKKPQYTETYILILTTGIKVSIDKIIYDALNKVLEKFEIKFE